jgi:uncharacterized protein (DUF58 family)
MNELAHRYLQPADLRRLRHVRFAPRRAVEGQYAGRHASPQVGRSVEFTDYRPYMPGDEIGDVDWKVFGRSDRLVVKRFEHQTDMHVGLLVDASASMSYRAETGPSKYDLACQLAAAIAFLVIEQQDKVAFAIARHGLRHVHPAAGSQKHLLSILDAMSKTQLGETAGLGEAMRRLAPMMRRRSLLIVFSDLLDDRDEILRGLAAFMSRGCEVIMFHTLHEHELTLPPSESALMIDSETGRRLTLNLHDVRKAYLARIDAFVNEWAAALRSRGIDCNLASTQTHYYHAMQRYLLQRASRK